MKYYHLLCILILFYTHLQSQSNVWEFAGGPYYGAATTMACNASGHIFAGAPSGLYRSTDNGNTWMCVTSSMGNPSVTLLAIKPDGKIFIRLSTNAIYRSDNNGNSWTPAGTGLPDHAVTTLKCKGADTVFALVDSSGIYCTTNDGTLWTSMNAGLRSVQVNAIFIGRNGILYAGTTNGAHYSTNNGAQWDTLPGMGTGNALNIILNSTGKIWCDIYDPSYLSLRYYSTDNGTSWTNLSMRLDSSYNPITHKWSYSHTFCYYPNIILIDSADNMYVNRYTPDIYKLDQSTDGTTWTTVIADSVALGSIGGQIYFFSKPSFDSLYLGQVKTLCFSPNGYKYVATTKGGILRFPSVGFGAWTRVNGFLKSRPVYSMVAKSQGKVFSMTEGGLYRLIQPANTWEFNAQFINTNNSCLALHPNGEIFLAYYPPYRTTDDGKHWDTCKTSMSSTMTIAIIPNGNIYTGSYLSYLYRSTDIGNTWQQITTPACSTLVAGKSGTIYAFGGQYFSCSSDSGNSWTTYNIMDYVTITIYSISASVLYSFAEVNNNFFLGTYDGIVRSTDNGATWSYANMGLPTTVKHKVTSMSGDSIIKYYGYPIIPTITSNTKGDIFIGCNCGVYCSTNGGDTWFLYNDGIPQDVSVSALTVDSSGFLYAGTTDGMVFKSTQTIVGVEDVQNIMPLAWKLDQNYPNPFNPITHIKYQISKLSKVSLKIYDLLGREVVALVNEEKLAGKYEVKWDAGKYASGIYFATICAGDYFRTIKLVLIK
jgi:photosystem II stability/assembly factor-like uncharacterized protein